MYNNDLTTVNSNILKTFVLLGEGASYGSWKTINLKESMDNFRILSICMSDKNGSTVINQISCPAHFKMHNINRVYILMSNGNTECLCGGGTSTTMNYYINGTVSGYSVALWGII